MARFHQAVQFSTVQYGTQLMMRSFFIINTFQFTFLLKGAFMVFFFNVFFFLIVRCGINATIFDLNI